MEDLALAKLLTKARLKLETALEVRFVLHQLGNHSNLELFPMSLQERGCTNCCKCTLRCECNLDKMVYLTMKQTDCVRMSQRSRNHL
jgi:hypothetical protein